MKQVLEPLSAIPGVRVAVLVTSDGVPVVVRGRAHEGGPDDPADGSPDAAESLAALASGWLNALTRAVAPLSWRPPERVVLKATRGTIVMLQAPGSVLLALLDGGTRAEDLRLPMQGAVARIQRLLRWSQPDPDQGAAEAHAEAPLPARPAGPGQAAPPATTDNSRTPIHRDLPG
jgi:predicted regulator of Ras-like GTPase activity (Roadblock/LC7/MglB family)